jgi:hypothetical protein
MKIGNSAAESLMQGGAGSVTGIDPETQPSASPRGAKAGSDSVKLSSGSNLIALTKASFSNAHAAKVQSIASRISAGLYQADSLQTSQAVVEGHLCG